MHPSLELVPGEKPLKKIVRSANAEIRISLIDCGVGTETLVSIGTFYRHPHGGWLPDARHRAVLRLWEIATLIEVLKATRERLVAKIRTKKPRAAQTKTRGVKLGSSPVDVVSRDASPQLPEYIDV